MMNSKREVKMERETGVEPEAREREETCVSSVGPHADADVQIAQADGERRGWKKVLKKFSRIS